MVVDPAKQSPWKAWREVALGAPDEIHDRMALMGRTTQGDTATARTYVASDSMMPDGQTGTHATGFYDDELMRTADGWRIARRHFTGIRFEAIGPA